MAADKTEPTNTDGIFIPQPDAGAAFKFEMIAMNLLLGHWKKLIGMVLIILFGVGAYGQVQSMNRVEQQRVASQISDARDELKTTLMTKLDETESQAVTAYGLGVDEILRMQDVEDADVQSAIQSSAEQLTAIAADATGQARLEANLNAANLYSTINDVDNQKMALTAALADANNAVLLSTNIGLAMIEVDSGDSEAAISRLTGLTTHSNQFIAQQATIEAATLLSDLDRDDEARALYVQFNASWPKSSRVTEVNDLMAGLSGQQ